MPPRSKKQETEEPVQADAKQGVVPKVAIEADVASLILIGLGSIPYNHQVQLPDGRITRMGVIMARADASLGRQLAAIAGPKAPEPKGE